MDIQASDLVTIGLLASLLVAGVAGAQENAGPRWVTAWGTSQHTIAGPTPTATQMMTDTTLRILARPTISGTRIRVRLENRFNDQPVTFDDAFLGAVNRGPMADLFSGSAANNTLAALTLGSNTRLTFGGSSSVTIPPGGRVTSDPIDFSVRAQQDLAISLHVPGADVRLPNHAMALTTSYVAPGNRASEEEFYLDLFSLFRLDGRFPSFNARINNTPFLTAIEVSSESPGAIVVLGDSITDGFCSTPDGHDRFVDVLARRLRNATQGSSPDAHKAVVNAGINGNTLSGNNGAVQRLDRDVLSLAGVTDVALFIGTNDIGAGAMAPQVISGMQQIIARVKEAGVRIFAATIIPRNPDTFFGTIAGFDDAKNAQRRAVNDWIRQEASLDGVLDFDRVMQEPGNPDQLRREFDCDGIHPNIAGYFAIGESIDLSLLMR